MDDLMKGATSLVATIGLSDSFLDDLRHSDDWTFIVKTAALLETVMAHVAVNEIGRSETTKFIAKLPATSKVRLVESLGVLPEYVKFFRFVADLRNTVVHDIQDTNFSFSDYLSDRENVQRFVGAIPGLKAKKQKKGSSTGGDSSADTLVKWAKTSIWIVVVGILANVYAHVELVETKQKMRRFYEAKGERGGPGLGDKDLWDSLDG